MSGPFTLSPLPFEESALEPVISRKTLSFHYGKHHAAYVEKLNGLVKGTCYADMKLEDVVKETHHVKSGGDKAIFNNAGQVWNHDFYWRSLSPNSAKPAGALKDAIDTYGGEKKLIEDIAAGGVAQFGSGWVWLTSENGAIRIEKTANAETPMARGVNCLVALDVWEHAYYLDYQNARAKYLNEVLARILNWDFAAENLAQEDHPVRAAA